MQYKDEFTYAENYLCQEHFSYEQTTEEFNPESKNETFTEGSNITQIYSRTDFSSDTYQPYLKNESLYNDGGQLTEYRSFFFNNSQDWILNTYIAYVYSEDGLLETSTSHKLDTFSLESEFYITMIQNYYYNNLSQIDYINLRYFNQDDQENPYSETQYDYIYSEFTENSSESIDSPNFNITNYPNPFNPETTISFNIIEDGDVKLEVFNVKGQHVKTLINDRLLSGNHQVVWKGRDENNSNVASGIYFYRIKSGLNSTTKKCILMK